MKPLTLLQFGNKNKKASSLLDEAESDSSGVRTQDPILKRDMLYQLS
jgi:hypothetical protein